MVDYRLEWFKERVSSLLEEEDDSVFQELLIRDDGKIKDQLVSFVNKSTDELSGKEETLVFFFKTFQRKIIEKRDATVAKGDQSGGASPAPKDVSSDEDGHDSSEHSGSKSPPPSRTLSLSAGKSGKSSGRKGRASIHRASVSSDSKSVKKAMGGSAKAVRKGRKSPSTVVETLTDDMDDKIAKESSMDTGGESSPEPQSLSENKQEIELRPVFHCKFGVLSETDFEQLGGRQAAMFSRRSNQGLKNLASWEEANKIMSENYIVASFAGSALSVFSSLLEKVFTPVFYPESKEISMKKKRSSSLDVAMALSMAQSITFAASEEESQSKIKSDETADIFENIKQLTSSLLQYQQSLIKFHLEEEEVEAIKKISAGDDAKKFEHLFEQIFARWMPQLQGHLDDITKKKPSGESPMAEVEHWEEIEVSLSGLNCSLQSGTVKQVCSAAKKISLEAAKKFEEAVFKVETLLSESREIARSFAPLINYFQALSECDCLAKASEILSKVINGLRFLWVLCSPYNQDERMEGILQRVAWQLCSKTSEILDMDTLFKQGADIAKTKAKEATKLLKSWKELYFQTRRVIERTGHTPRWEFDVRKLFGQSEYIREVCVDLTEICDVLIHFRNVLNLHLKAVISNQTMVDLLLKQVALLIAPIQQDADFEVFVAANADSWRSFMNHFRRNVLLLEQNVCTFLNDSISHGNMCSAEDALKMLQIFQTTETRSAIKVVINSKYEVVIKELVEEIQTAKKTFLNNKDVPPLLRNQPRDAGAIYWCRCLFDQLKKSVVQFKKCKQLHSNALLVEAFDQYVLLARHMKVYQAEHFENWTIKTEKIIKMTMSAHLIKVIKKREEKKTSTTAVERRLGSLFASSDGGAQSASETSSRMMLRPVLASLRWVARAVAARKRASVASESTLVLPHIGLEPSDASVPSLGLQYEVGFSDDLFLVLSEAEMMEQLGLEVSILIKNTAVQKATMESSVRRLRASVRKLNEMLSPLDVAEISLLQFALKKLERTIEPGIFRLKWMSQSVSDFCEELEEAVDSFGASVQQFKLCAAKAQQQTELIQSFNLFYVEDLKEALPWQIFFEKATTCRKASVSEMVQAFKTLSKILVDLEFLMDKTHTGRKDCMRKYYLHWEQLFFEALLKALVGSLDHFSSILSGGTVILQIDALLDVTNLRLNPNSTSAFSTLMASAKEVILSSKHFRRWMDGTCIWCPDEGEPKAGQPYATKEFTFLEDVAKIDRIKERHSVLKCIAEDLLVKVQHELANWEKYSLLWKYDKATTCQLFSSGGPSIIECDEKLAYFSAIEEEMNSAPRFVNINCIRINLSPLIDKILAHAAEWKWHLAQNVITTSKKEMKVYLWSMWSLQADVDQVVREDDVDTLKEVLEAIVKIRNSNTDREVQAYFIRENYRTMTAHNIKVEPRDSMMSQKLWKMWLDLYEMSKVKAKKLAEMHKKYSELTIKAAEEFHQKCCELEERFNSAGPGCVGADLSRGLLLLEDYKQELLLLENEKQMLSTDEYLFDVPLSDHAKLTGVQKQMVFLQEVFDLFAQLKSAKDKWSSTLWVDLSPGSLSEGIKQFGERFEELSEEAKSQAVADQLKSEIDGFKSSVPLFEALKCDALRDRHWLSLMDSTRKHFDTSPESLRLQNLFEMELHLHESTTFQILNQAEEELKIENLLGGMQKTWHLLDFGVEKLEREGEDYGLILSSFEEALVHLTDHQVQLKKLLNSIFVGPFLENVHFWEQKLSIIEESIQLWTSVREKWINLEVLFANKDLHVHLPPMALKKFDSCRKMHHKMIKEIAKNPQILPACRREGNIDDLKNLLLMLETSQTAFNDFLFSKRQIFPRLYFVSDEELITILAGDLPDCFHQMVQKESLFPKISNIRVTKNNDGDGFFISGFSSLENEFVEFKKPLKTEDMEKINMLSHLNDKIKSAVTFKLNDSVQSILNTEISIENFVKTCPANLSLPGLQVLWTRSVEERMLKMADGDIKALRRYLDEINSDINNLALILKGPDSTLDKAKLTSAFILICHFKEIVEQLFYSGVVNKLDYLWDSQLRFYWTDGQLTLKQAFSDLIYGYEFTGTDQKLISTPETDRVKLIITQSLSLQLGILVSGHSGVGKSEIIRDLARTLGRQFASFDCTPSTPWGSVGRVLSGVAQSGFWGCLKQFNLLVPSSLSIISAQLQTLKTALAMGLRSFNFNGTEVKLDRAMAVFATVRPGQVGCTELPLTLTALFRPAACTPPDLYIICAVRLQALGFTNFKKLARKLTKFCDLCSDKLSKQSHYSFGLNQMNKIFILLERTFSPNEDVQREEQFLFSALKTSIEFQLQAGDRTMFAELVKDVFPRIEGIAFPDTSNLVENILQASGYQVLEEQKLHICHLQRVLENSNSALVIGESGGGKSAIIEIYLKLLKEKCKDTKAHYLSPKSCSLEEFFGFVKNDKFIDGLFSKLFYEACAQSCKSIFIFDSQMDPIWIENLSSILDKNHCLTEFNADRKHYDQNQISFIFESGSLQLASPAILSRTTPIYVDSNKLNFEAVWTSILEQRFKSSDSKLAQLFKKYISPLFDFIENSNLKCIVPFSRVNAINQFADMLEILITGKDEFLEARFVQALYLSVGSTLLDRERENFDSKVKSLSKLEIIKDNCDNPAKIKQMPKQKLYGYFWDEEKESWINWQWITPKKLTSKLSTLEENLIPTPMTIFFYWLMDKFVASNFQGMVFKKINRPLVLIGEEGCSKTLMTQSFLKSLESATYLHQSFNLSLQTKASDIRTVVRGMMQNRTRNIMEPLSQKKLILFLDDLNLPLHDMCGSQETIEFLRILLEQGGFYNEGTDFNWVQLEHIGLMGSITSDEYSPSKLDTRFISKLNLVHIPKLSDALLHNIYSIILADHLETFAPEVQKLSDDMVSATLHLFKILHNSLPPTPARWMCQLGVRDLTRLFGGLCQTQPQNFSNPETLVRVWRHEICRVFADRLEADEDQVMIQNLVRESVKEYFEPYLEHTLRNPVLFGDFRNALTHTTDQRYYEDLLDFEAVFFLFQEVLEELNKKRDGPKLDVVLFDTALEHLSRLHRVLRMRRGHTVLVGDPGSGRKSLFSLAANAAQCRPFRLPFSSKLVPRVIREIYTFIGVEKKSAALFIIDADIKQQGVSEIIYHMMTTGWVPGVFNKEEKGEILEKLKESSGKENEESEKLWMNFQNDCVSRLHVVLSLERETLYSLTQQYPEFLSFTMLDWYRPWNENALRKVGKHFISNNPLIPDTETDFILSHVIQTHASSHEMYSKSNTNNINCSPRLYIDFIQLVLELLQTHLDTNEKLARRLNIALSKIDTARASISKLKSVLFQKEEDLKTSKTELEKITNEISKVSETKEKRSEVSTEWDRGIERQVRILASDRIQVQRILDCAVPDLNSAKEAFENIQQTDVDSIRSWITQPVEYFRPVCESILMLRGENLPDTEGLIAIFENASKVKQLAAINCDNISNAVCRKVKIKIKRGGKLDELYETCPVAQTFMALIDAVLQYCNVLREVKPKLELTANVEAELIESRKKSEVYSSEIKSLEETLSSLQDQKAKMEGEIQVASDIAQDIKQHLEKTEKLFISLEKDEDNLKKEVSALEEKSIKLLGDCLLVAAFVSYGGPLSPQGDRQDLIEGWMQSLESLNIPFSNVFEPDEFLAATNYEEESTDASEFDNATLQNFLLVFQSVRAPLCIDPQQQAASWIKTVEKDLILASAFDFDLVEKIEAAAVAGKAVLLQDLSHSISSALFNILDRVIITEGERNFVKIGDNLVELNKKFKIYFNTREANPNLNPVVFSKTTVIDCTMTAQALEDILIKDVVKVKDPANYRRQKTLREKNIELQKTQNDLQMKLTESLVEVPDEGLLDNQNFLDLLEETKNLIITAFEEAVEIKTQQEEFSQVQSEFREIAQRAAILFSVLADLAHMSPTYLFSLTTFQELLASSIQEAATKTPEKTFGDSVSKIITMNVHSFACRSLFAEHQLPFTLAMILRIKLSKGEASLDEVKYLTAVGASKEIEIEQNLPDWMSKEVAKTVSSLQEVFPELFGTFLQDVCNPVWHQWLQLAMPEKVPLPMGYSEKLTEFQVLLVVKALRNDRVVPAILNYICDNYGQHFITPIIPSMRSLLNESTSKVPILFIVSGGGVDPSTELQRLSKQMGLDHGQFVSLALGKGSEKSAIAALQNAVRRGQWLLLLNCHLVPNLPALVWCYLDQSQPHQDFRLWITTDRTATLPPILLHNALKVVLETPKGLKLKLNSTFRKIDPDMMSKNKHSDFGKILYVMAHFHATIQERGEFANIGWNEKYHFTKPDFDACAYFLDKFLVQVKDRKIPWESIQKFMEQVVYGAHMNDQFDARVIVTYLQEFCGAFIFNTKFYFYQDDSISYGLPSIQNLFGILAYIQNLPLNYSPVVLGLHSNSSVVYNRTCLSDLITNLMKLQPQPAIPQNDIFNQEELLLAVERMQKMIPEQLDEMEIKRFKCLGSAEHFIMQEVNEFNKLLTGIQESLNSLENALKGRGKMTKELKLVQLAIVTNAVPENWKKLSPPTNKNLPSWLKHLQKRFRQYYDWVMKHEPLVAWLPGLSNPRSYLMTVLQNACRKYHWPIEQAGLVAKITAAKHLPALKDGIYVKGIYLENGGWDSQGQCLKSADVCSLSEALPVIQITAAKNAPEQEGNCVRLPLYFTHSHTETLIWQLDLPCIQHHSTWFLQGTKLVLNPE